MRQGLAAAIIVAMATLSACGRDERLGGTDGTEKPPLPEKGDSDYALKVYLERDGERELVLVPPKDPGTNLGGAIPEDGAQGEPGLRTQGLIDTGDEVIDTNVRDEETDNGPGDTLLLYLARSCAGDGSTYGVLTPKIHERWEPTGYGHNWYNHDRSATSPGLDNCDDILAYQEVLLCTADRLAEIADATGPVSWKSYDSGFDPDTTQSTLTITIPPQATQDKFIARDMALNVLAHLALVDWKVPGNWESAGDHCEVIYAELAETGARFREEPNTGDIVEVNPFQIVGLDYVNIERPLADEDYYFEPNGLPLLNGKHQASDLEAVGASRLRYRAQLFASASRLVRRLVEDNVRDDLAGAERLRAEAGAPAAGLRAMWGVEGDEGRYNSLRHVLRTIYGRLEIGRPSVEDFVEHLHDPACTGHLATDLTDALGVGFESRWSDVPPQSAKQALLLSIVESAGIVIPEQVVDEATKEELAAALKAQLVLGLQEQREGGGQVGSLTLSVLDDMLEDVSRQDLQVAFHGARLTYFALNNISFVPTAGTLERAQEVIDMGGRVTVLDRGNILRSADSSLAPAEAASGCGLYDEGVLTELGIAEAEVRDYRLQKGMFQSPFALAQVMQVILARTRETAKTLPSATDLERFAGAAAAESREWAGPGRVYVTPIEVGFGAYFKVLITLEGVRAKDYGLSTSVDLVNRLVVLRNNAHDVGCVTGKRTDCENHTPLVATLGDPVFVADVPSWLDGDVVEIEATVSSAPPEFLVVALRPDSLGRGGTVLAAVRVYPPDDDDDDDTTMAVVSNRQRQLARSIFGSPAPTVEVESCGGIASLSMPSKHCVGIERNSFVPLGNDLTGSVEGNDSWRYYLERARSAAATADSLGRELISAGLNREIRKEAALEQVSELCGSFPDTENIAIEGGAVTAVTGDARLASCLGEGEDNVDLVFFTDEWARYVEGLGDAGIREAFCSDDDDVVDPPFCNGTTAVGVKGLGLVPLASASNGDVACDEIASVFAAGEFHQPRFLNALLSDWAGEPGLSASLSMLELREYYNGWELLAAGEPLMGSSPHLAEDRDIWPGCENHMDGCCQISEDPDNCEGKAERFKVLFGPDKHIADIELAIWQLAAMVGELPAGVFTKPLAAANYSEGMDPYSDRVPAPTLYNDGRFEQTGLDLGDSTEWRLVQPTCLYDGGPYTQQECVDWMDSRPLAVFYRYKSSGPDMVAWASHRLDTYSTLPAWQVELLTHIRDSPTDFLYGWFANVGVDGFASPRPLYDRLQVLSRSPDLANAASEVWSWTSPAFDDTCRNAGGLERLYLSLTPTPGAIGTDGTYDGYHNPAPRDVDVGVVPPRLAKVDQPGYPSNPGAAACQTTVGEQWRVLPLQGGYTPHSYNFPSCDRKHTKAALRASGCPPWERVHLFTAAAPYSDEQAMRAVVHALGLSCSVANDRVTLAENEPPPPITTLADIQRLEIWLNRAAIKSNEVAQRLYLVDVPPEVVDDFRNGKVATGAVGSGSHGALVLQLEQGMSDIHSGWGHMAAALAQMKGAVAAARVELQGLDIEKRADALEIAKERLEMDRASAMQSLSNASSIASLGTKAINVGYSSSPDDGGSQQSLITGSFFGGGFSQALGLASAVFSSVRQSQLTREFDAKLKSLLEDQQENSEEGYENSALGVVANLSTSMSMSHQNLADAIKLVKDGTSKSLAAINELSSNRSRAVIAVAKATEADYAGVDGKLVDMPVNRVQRRQFDALRGRYVRALATAKREAYLARLAVEQKLGVRLSDIHVSVGPVIAPSLWADEICSLQGVNYDALAVESDGEKDFGQFAEAFIGDYVDQLEEFVDFYNVEYPFQEGTGKAVLSMREDLLGPQTQCLGNSANRLYYSHDLSSIGDDGDHGVSEYGWSRTCCFDSACLSVLPGGSRLDADGDPLMTAPDGVGGVSWLRAESKSLPSDDGSPIICRADSGAAPLSVYQSVPLEKGESYVLSWEDLAVTPAGLPLPSGAYEYAVVVYNSTWGVAALLEPTATGEWSGRRTLGFSVVEDGYYHITFSLANRQDAGVAIANVQVADVGDLPGTHEYVPTQGSRRTVLGDCRVRSPESFRRAFDRRCDAQSCWFELKYPFQLDTVSANQGASAIVDHLAQGNYNYRHRGVSVNLVGTGVLDCTDSAGLSCYAEAFVPYDLQHIANNVPLLDYSGNPTCFDFRTGQVKGGKAIAAERYLTLPLGSVDAELLGQGGMTAQELVGRPLSGSYILRIRDTDALVWDRVEDVQLILTYDYWSRVE